MTPLASFDFGRMLSVGTIHFEDRFVLAKKVGLGGVGVGEGGVGRHRWPYSRHAVHMVAA